MSAGAVQGKGRHTIETVYLLSRINASIKFMFVGIVFLGEGYYNIRKIHFVIFYGKMHIIEKEGIMKDGEHVLSAEYEHFWD